MIRKGWTVWDIPTRRLAVVESRTSTDIDGQRATMFKLSNIPQTDDYPTPWRRRAEISIADLGYKFGNYKSGGKLKEPPYYKTISITEFVNKTIDEILASK